MPDARVERRVALAGCNKKMGNWVDRGIGCGTIYHIGPIGHICIG